MIGKPPRTSLNDHKRLRCLRRKKTRRFDCGGSAKSASGLCPRLWPSFARSFRALGVRRLLLPTFSHRGNRQACGLPRTPDCTILQIADPCIGIRLFRKPKACMIALRKARKKWRRRRERPERVCKKRSLLCPLSERRRRHPRLFAVLDLLVLLGQAKSTKKKRLQTAIYRGSGAIAPRGAKPPPAEARHIVVHSAGFNPHFLEKVFSCSFFRRKSQRRPRGENDRETAAHLAERSQKTALFCTIVPGARCATASSPDIFTSRNHAGQRPAEKYKTQDRTIPQIG